MKHATIEKALRNPAWGKVVEEIRRVALDISTTMLILFDDNFYKVPLCDKVNLVFSSEEGSERINVKVINCGDKEKTIATATITPPQELSAEEIENSWKSLLEANRDSIKAACEMGPQPGDLGCD